MDPISNADRLAALLRQRLAERARTEGGAGRGAAGQAGRGAVDRVEALGGVGDHSGRAPRRLLVETILSEELGPHLVNDPGFQQVVDRVVDAIESDSGAAELLGRAVEEARSGG